MSSAAVEQLLSYLDDDERSTLEKDLRAIAPKPKGRPVPDEWRRRIPITFPRYASAPFAKRHEEFWEWENGIRVDSAPDPFVGIWPRGGAKSTSAEMAVADLGCRNKRKYVLYVRATQLQADKSVANIATLLESPEVAHYYPEHADRSVGKFGNAKGWRREQLRTKGGLTVDAIGLDTAARGAKIDEQRPDLIVFDDIDELLDSLATTKKKEETITKSILPAGANNCAVLFIQNLIIRDGVASKLSDGRADYLALRKVSGPFPALDKFTYEWKVDPATGIRRAMITGGEATWEGQPLEACQRFIHTWGLSAFIKEAQHKVYEKPEGVCLRFEPTRHYVDVDDDQVRALVKKPGTKAFAGIDPQWWRFGFTLWIVKTSGVVIRIAELFSQAEVLWVRARKIHELCVDAGFDDPSPKTIPIWADAANPQDIAEINLAFRTGWAELDDEGHETGVWITSKLRVIKVDNDGKLRRVAVQRINNALDKNMLLFRRSVGVGTSWMLGKNAGSEGTETKGSRLMWEVDNWAVPMPKEGEAQDENPDDDTADGADLIASARYALMSHWRPGKDEPNPGQVEDDRAERFDVKKKTFVPYPHVADPLFNETATRRRPPVRGVRPRIR
jgi:hypothetical protein